jgi:hypothetical protein
MEHDPLARDRHAQRRFGRVQPHEVDGEQRLGASSTSSTIRARSSVDASGASTARSMSDRGP